MLTLNTALCLVALVSSAALSRSQTDEKPPVDSQAETAANRRDVNDEMHLINKSLEDLMNELAVIKREATGRLSNVKNRVSTNDQERIRQIKVSRFVLKRVAELELESLGMRDEMEKLFQIQKDAKSKRPTQAAMYSMGVATKQDDFDFDDSSAPVLLASPSTTTTTTTTTAKPEEEAAAIGFDLEALKKLGNELESEIEARQAQNPESLRGVHEQVIRLVDNMVQNYLGNVRRAVNRVSNFIDNRRSTLTSSQPRHHQSAIATENQKIDSRDEANFSTQSQSVIGQLQSLSRGFRDFTLQWSRTLGKQQSPLLDRIPPRGVELWRDFWDTVRKQVRRINQEFWQLSQDMSRMVTGRLPSSLGSTGPGSRGEQLRQTENLLYSGAGQQEQVVKQFQEFYDKLSVTLGQEQLKMDELSRRAQLAQSATSDSSATSGEQNKDQQSNLIDEQDDEMTRNELTRNVALRQQIQQEINVFGSIFDIMGAFIQRLRESASVVRDVLQPGAANNNDAVTPGPSVKPQVDSLLQETINSQRNINSQAKPVLLPNRRGN